MSEPKALALTRGDPSGIGLEVAFKAWLATHRAQPANPFVLVADIDHCRRAARDLGLDVPIVAASARDAPRVFADALPVLPMTAPTIGVPGHPDVADAAGTIASLEEAVRLVAAEEAAAVVTLPVSKEILHRVGYPHPGQTEFMGEAAQRHFGIAARPVMLLWSPDLAVVPATIHVPVAQVPRLVTRELVVETVRIVERDYRTRLRIAAPRIAVTGLNPHAGEGGDIGGEEIAVIAPALDQLRSEGIDVTGPHPADTLFHAAARSRYDVAVTMYHDQALIPIKTLAFDSAVNATLGLPFVRTSPDHGTAYDIAGRGVADPSSLVAALGFARRLVAADAAA